MSIIDLVNIRELCKYDVNFILDSSIQCLSKYRESIVKGMTKSAAISHLETLILYGLSKMSYSIFIACDVEDEHNIFGYIVANPTSNHIFLQYTKYVYRGLGIQKNLLLPLVIDNGYPISCNWPTKEMLKLAKEGKIEIQKQFEDELIRKLYEV